MKYKCYNIKYDVSFEDAFNDLANMNGKEPTDTEVEEHIDLIKSRIPEEVVIKFDSDGMTTEEIEDQLSDEISNATGWLHGGFEYEEVK